MNTPSPLVPQGTTPAPKRRSLPTAFFLILFAHVGVLGLLLLQGCKGDPEPAKPVVDAGASPTFGADAGASNGAPAGIGHDLSNTVAGISSPLPPPGVPSGVAPAGLGAGQPAPGAAPTGLAPLPNTSPVPPAPTAPVAEPTVSSTPSSEHTVLKGETLATIAKKHGMGWKAIAAANPGVDAAKLKIGQKLVIPEKSVSSATARADGGTSPTADAGASGGGSVHVVKSGDTLAKVAKSHGTTVKALKAANGIKLDKITVGQKLKIPAKHSAAPAETAPAPLPGAGFPAGSPPAPDASPSPSPVSLPPPTRVP